METFCGKPNVLPMMKTSLLQGRGFHHGESFLGLECFDDGPKKWEILKGSCRLFSRGERVNLETELFLNQDTTTDTL